MYDLVIGGRTVSTASRFPVLNPASGEVVAEAPNATEADLDRAVAAAAAAFGEFSARPEAERQQLCEAMAAKLEEHSEELARLLTLEQGKPLNGLGSRWELGAAVAWARHTCSLSLPVKVIQDDNRGTVELHRKPLGVVGSITPWNFPILIAVWHVFPAVLTGNTVVI